MSALRFAFVGCGGIARHHLKALEGCSHPTQVVAVVDTKKENAQQFRELIDSANDCQVSGRGLFSFPGTWWGTGYPMHVSACARASPAPCMCLHVHVPPQPRACARASPAPCMCLPVHVPPQPHACVCMCTCLQACVCLHVYVPPVHVPGIPAVPSHALIVACSILHTQVFSSLHALSRTHRYSHRCMLYLAHTGILIVACPISHTGILIVACPISHTQVFSSLHALSCTHRYSHRCQTCYLGIGLMQLLLWFLTISTWPMHKLVSVETSTCYWRNQWLTHLSHHLLYWRK